MADECGTSDQGKKGGQYRVNDALDEVDKDLKQEEEKLLKAKELILKEIRILNVSTYPPLAPSHRLTTCMKFTFLFCRLKR